MDEDTTGSQGREGTRERKKDETRARIADDVIALMAEGRLDISHDLVAERTGIARRTIYRYFPDRQELLGGASTRVRELAGPGVRFPESEADLTGTLLDTYTGFDRIAPITTLMRSTPQGRAMRMAQNDMRVERYTAVTADAVKDLPEEDRKLATALLQMLHTTPWLEMRDHWGLTGEEIARATGWAIRTLLADLRSRGDRPLSD